METRYHEAGRRWAAAHPSGARRLAVLRAIGDVVVPSVRPPTSAAGTSDPGFWRRRASDLQTADAVAGYLAARLSDEDAAGIAQLLDLLGAAGVHRLPAPARQLVLRGLAATSADVARGLEAVRTVTLLLFYGMADADGSNPNWEALGYPGPPDTTPPPRQLRSASPAPDGDRVLHADVCIVGSGAGGGVIAAELARAGLEVIVLEAGGPMEAADVVPYELEAYDRLYWRGGYTPTVDGNVTVVAGATLGGGTTVNWTNCVQPPEAVRSEWAEVHRLDGLDGAAFDEHLRAVGARISVTQACSDRNGPNEVLAAGADALGWSWQVAARNTDQASYDPATAGHLGFGDRSGSKRGTATTSLVDAATAGARILTRTRARTVSTEAGRATGVEAEVTHDDGSTSPLTVRARTVVVAAGGLESPALLLRSGIGGPAVGRHLHLHPAAALAAFTSQDQRAWWGPPQSVVVDEFAQLTDGYGFLIECSHFGTALSAASVPWRSGRDHKLLMGRSRTAAPAFAMLRDRGEGRVTIDAAGEAVLHYPFVDALDREHLRQGLRRVAELQRAAGATAIVDLAPTRRLWRAGEDLDAYLDVLVAERVGAGGRPLFSAHQMGTARMGPDPETSVADPDGQLHDVPGVWIGDTSAFPSATGANPMLTCMALARRTAHAILADRDLPAATEVVGAVVS